MFVLKKNPGFGFSESLISCENGQINCLNRLKNRHICNKEKLLRYLSTGIKIFYDHIIRR